MTEYGKELWRRGHCSRRAHWLLFFGAVAGVTMAALGVLFESIPEPPVATMVAPLATVSQSLPIGVVARVNGRLIQERDFQEVLNREVAGGISPNATEKRKILDGMINEDLRVQKAISLGLHYTDSRVRMDLATAVAEAAVIAAEQQAPDEATLRAYFEERRDYFMRRGPLRVRSIWVGIVAGNLGEAFSRARTATKLLREKEAFDTVRDVVGSSDHRPVPGRLLRPDELSVYIGPAALSEVLLMSPGQVSEPIRATDGFYVFQVLERHTNEGMGFEEARLVVESEYWSERTRRALEANAIELRKTADIQRAEAL